MFAARAVPAAVAILLRDREPEDPDELAGGSSLSCRVIDGRSEPSDGAEAVCEDETSGSCDGGCNKPPSATPTAACRTGVISGMGCTSVPVSGGLRLFFLSRFGVLDDLLGPRDDGLDLDASRSVCADACAAMFDEDLPDCSTDGCSLASTYDESARDDERDGVGRMGSMSTGCAPRSRSCVGVAWQLMPIYEADREVAFRPGSCYLHMRQRRCTWSRRGERVVTMADGRVLGGGGARHLSVRCRLDTALHCVC